MNALVKNDKLVKGLAIAGDLFVWLPLLAPLAFSILSLAMDGQFRFDYLMPAELFPVALFGGVLLLWAALWARSRRAWIGGALGAAIALLVSGQALAVVTGLASGQTEPTGWAWMLVLASLAIYALALVVMGVGGGLLVRDLFRPASGRATPA